MEKLKVFSLFSGIGAFEKALTNLHIDYDLVGFSEIDKHAIKSYCAIHNVEESLNYGDVSLIDKEKIPDFDLLVGGSPCQAFSVAGHRKGFEDTRGTLVFEYIDTLHKKQPKYFLYENVKGLINHDKGRTLDIIAQGFNEVGYRIDICLLNSKYFNVPQHRERLFIVGVREDLVNNEEWLLDDKNKDVLSKGKVRLKELGIKSFNFKYPTQININRRLRDVLEENVDENFYLSEEKTMKLISQLEPHNNSIQKEHIKQIPVEYNRKNGIGKELEHAHTLSASDWRGLNRNQTQNAVLEVRPVLTPDREEKRQQGRRFKENDEPAFTVNTQDRHGIAIGTYPTYRIRKLTPLECFRLQAFTDEDFKKCQDVGISNSQLYKQAGNSITVSVLEYIFKELFNDKLIHNNTYINENMPYKKAE